VADLVTTAGRNGTTPRYPFVTLSNKRFVEVVTTLRRTLAYLPDNSTVECEVRALLEALEERRDT
jgi:hypothetical protein